MPEASTSKEQRQRRIIETLEAMLTDDRTPKPESDAAKARWEHITGKQWTGKSSAKQQKTQQSNTSSNRNKYEYNPEPDEKFWEDIFGKGFGGFNYNGRARSSRHDDSYDSRSYGSQYSSGRRSSNADYDFSFNPCTDKQFDYLDAICRFFRWKHPDRGSISFEEASSFLNRHSGIYNMFTRDARNVMRLKELFETFGIDWNATKRTWTWDYEKKGGRL